MGEVATRGRQVTTAPNNLRHSLTSFVGREADLQALKTMLGESRLVTLTGTGGAGKTRLAAEIAGANLDMWPDGAWWVDLAAAKSVDTGVLEVLHLPGRGPGLDVITSWVGPRHALVVLDNCEHLVAEAAAFCHVALERCPHLSVIATSREPLGVPGEARRPVISLPDDDAVTLFEARARLAVPAFKVTALNRPTVIRICHRLDGLPLAIEMAAARLDMMTEQELLANLDDRFRVLTSGHRIVPERQQTMAATIEWSYRLLGVEEAALFRSLSVFRGAFTLEAAGAVFADDAGVNVIQFLSGLVKKSMVVAERADDGETGYRLLESHQSFAAQKLAEMGETELARRRHYEHFKRRQLRTRDIANAWAALEWAGRNAEDAGLGLAVEVAGIEWTDSSRALAVLLDLLPRSPERGAVRARALNLAARLVSMQGDYAAGSGLAAESVALAREIGDPGLLAYIVNGAGMISQARGDLESAGSLYEEALALVPRSGDRRLEIEIMNCIGLLAVERAEYATALDVLEKCVAGSRAEADDASAARHLESLANAQLGLGDVNGAASSWTEALSIYRALDDSFGKIWCLGGLALVAAARHDDERTLRLAAVVERISREWSLSTGPTRQGQIARACRQAQSRLGVGKSKAVRADGDAMETDSALDYALAGSRQNAEEIDAGPLSRREREVAAMVAAGLTNREIAERLFIAERTAEGHVERIRGKLGVRSRTEVATWAVERGLARGALDKPDRPSKV